MEFTLPAHLALARTSTYEELVGALRRLVLDGSLPPGSQLREVPLAQSFGVSRNTVREAVRALKHEGLVRHDRHHSAVVATLTEDDAADLYRVRRTLELGAADRLPEAAPQLVDAVSDAFEQLEKVVAIGEWWEVIASDLAFHRSLVGLHGSPRLLRAFAAIESECAFCLGLLRLHEHEDLEPAAMIAEHEAIREAVRSRRREAASSLIAAHLDNYEARTREILRGIAPAA